MYGSVEPFKLRASSGLLVLVFSRSPSKWGVHRPGRLAFSTTAGRPTG